MNCWRPSFLVDLARKWHSSLEDWQTPLIRIRGARACNFLMYVVTFLFLLVAVSGSAGRLNGDSLGRAQLPTEAGEYYEGFAASHAGLPRAFPLAHV